MQGALGLLFLAASAAAGNHGPPIVVEVEPIELGSTTISVGLTLHNASNQPVACDLSLVLLRLSDETALVRFHPRTDGHAADQPLILPAGASHRIEVGFTAASPPRAKFALVLGGFEADGQPIRLPDLPLQPRDAVTVEAPKDAPPQETVVRAKRDSVVDLPSYRAVSSVQHADLERRLPESTPEAIAYEPGVFITNAGHGRSSAYVRGLTGQQTVTLFDGIRINNSTYRAGPSQYLFAVDRETIDHVELLRGGASTEFGSDALGGVILAVPVLPNLRALDAAEHPRVLKSRLRLRSATADDQLGGRAEVEAGVARPSGLRLGFLGGVGGRRAGFLESAGSVENPNPNTTIGPYPLVPRFAPDGRTQLGTGYKELTADGRVVIDYPAAGTLTLAGYVYRQYDAPKTDRCPAPYAPYDSCLTYEEQFRHLLFAAYEPPSIGWLAKARIAASLQEQNERQRLNEPMVYSVHRSLDRVYTAGFVARAITQPWRPRPSLAFTLSSGLDTYVDWVRSSANLTFTNVNVYRDLTRGQYLGGSRYLYGGIFTDGQLGIRERISLRAGARLSWFGADVPADSGVEHSGGHPELGAGRRSCRGRMARRERARAARQRRPFVSRPQPRRSHGTAADRPRLPVRKPGPRTRASDDVRGRRARPHATRGAGRLAVRDADPERDLEGAAQS